MTKRVFISYRRVDTQMTAGRLHDGLVRRFSIASVFRDKEAIRPGHDWIDEIQRVLGENAVVVALIGPQWTSARDADGRRRLDDPDDTNRIELETALAKQAPVIPVLVEGATIPAADDVPASLRPLTRRHALRLRDDDWDTDFARLASALSDLGIGAPDGAANKLITSRGPLIAAAAGLALVAVSVWFWLGQPSKPPASEMAGPTVSAAPAPASNNQSEAGGSAPSTPLGSAKRDVIGSGTERAGGAAIEFVGEWKQSSKLTAIAIAQPFALIGSDQSNELQVGKFDDSGRRLAFDHAISLAAPPFSANDEPDIEGLAISGRTVYVVGSHALARRRPREGASDEVNLRRIQMVARIPERERVYRFILSDSGKLASRVEAISLETFISKSSELNRFSQLPARENGVEIAGVAAKGDLLYAGLRGPVLTQGRAAVIRFNFEAPELAQLLRIDLGGLGIWDLAAVPDGFLVLAGPNGYGGAPHRLYHWDGTDAVRVQGGPGGQTKDLGVLADCDGGRPEGVAVLRESAAEYRLAIVFERSEKTRCARAITIKK